MTADNRTNEELATRLRQFAEVQAMDFDSPHVAMTLNEVADRLVKPNETKSANNFVFTEAQVEAAAKAIWDRYAGHGLWETLPPARKAPFLKDARAALVAAQELAPQAKPAILEGRCQSCGSEVFEGDADEVTEFLTTPVLTSSGVDEGKLTEVIGRDENYTRDIELGGWMLDPRLAARAVVAYLRGES